jgi:outer membrane protein, adhesin transport system
MAVAPAAAQSLQEVVQWALQSNAAVAEGEAAIGAAQARLQASRYQHWPTLGVSASKGLANVEQESKPFVRGSVNVWAGGSIAAQIRADEQGVAFADNKLAETRAELAFKVGGLYLDAVRADAGLAVTALNLQRHDKIIGDLQTIARYDTGRQADLLQAQARRAQVVSTQLTLQSDLQAAQSRLAQYSPSYPTVLRPVAFDAAELRQALADPTPNAALRAQDNEVRRAEALVDVARGNRWPRLSLETTARNSRPTAQLALNWDFFDRSAGATANAAALQAQAAQARRQTIADDVLQRRRTAQIDIDQAQGRLAAASAQIDAVRSVASAYEKQFLIARRSLVDLLNAYSELAAVEFAQVRAQQDLVAAGLRALYASDRIEAYFLSHTVASRP